MLQTTTGNDKKQEHVKPCSKNMQQPKFVRPGAVQEARGGNHVEKGYALSRSLESDEDFLLWDVGV